MATSPDISLGPGLTREQALAFFAQGQEAVVWALLAQAHMLAQQQATAAGSSHQTPATPSGMQPPFAKPAASSRRKKPGRKPGYPGVRRPAPERIDIREEHRTDRCPDCGGSLHRCAETRTRYTEDIPVIQPVITQYDCTRASVRSSAVAHCHSNDYDGAHCRPEILTGARWAAIVLTNQSQQKRC